MEIFAFRHVRREHLGWIEPVLLEHGFAIRYFDLPENPAQEIPLAAASGLVVMGGPMSANDDLPFLNRELGILKSALAAGKPVMGVCLGAQLLAKALGSSVYANPCREIGWYPVHWTSEAADDALFGGLSGPETIFHWHGETYDLPAGAVRLAYSDACHQQAFRFGRAAYGLQFHLEVTPAMIEEWTQEDERCGEAREMKGPIDAHAHAGRLEQLSRAVFGAWAMLVRDTVR